MTFGLTDWESTEVIDGVTEGQHVYLVSVVVIRNQQRDSEQRIRERAVGLGGATSARPVGAGSGRSR